MNRPRALVIDADPDFRQVLADHLELDGWECLGSPTGLGALQELGQNPPQLILMEQRLPDINGCELHRKIRAQGVRAPVILVTASLDPENVARWGGFRFAIAKPFDITRLLSIIQEAGVAGEKWSLTR